jgi:hypothetical protein
VKATIHTEPPDFSLVLDGPLYQFYLRSRLAKAPIELLHRRIIAFVLITWVPLWLLTAIEGHALGGVKVPFLLDLDAHARFLVSLPLLIIAELFVHRRIRVIVGQFINRGLIAPEELPRFEHALVSSMRLRNSMAIEILVLLVAFIGGHWLWKDQMSLRVATWWGELALNNAVNFNLAGYWYVFISLPLFRFLLFRWYFRVLIWYRFLWLVSKISLRLNALHPDRAAGLGFLGNSVFAFAPVLLAQTVLLSAVIMSRIWHQGAVLPDFKLEILGIVVFLLILALLPLTFFALQLARARRAGRREYGALGSRYVETFRQKWLAGAAPENEPLVGSSDIQSLADLANSFEVVKEMDALPFNKNTVLGLAIVVVLPLLPLTLTMIPLDEMIDRAIKLLV